MGPIPVVDVFAGPGGLNEGFSARRDAEGSPIFSIVASFEMETNAVQTLRLRAAVRSLSTTKRLYVPYRRFLAGQLTLAELYTDPQMVSALDTAAKHVHQIELGESRREQVRDTIRKSLGDASDFVLIGGPPCQAYSLVGRARRTNDATFEDDHKHFLYREYLDIVRELKPTVFVMENVKGLLSAGHRGQPIFERILADLRMNGDYTIHSLVSDTDDPSPHDYIIRSEEYGIPQRRHRVILLGVRKDAARASWTALTTSDPVTVGQVLHGLSAVSASASRTPDPEGAILAARALADKLFEQSRVTGSLRLPNPRQAPQELRSWLAGNRGLTLGSDCITLHEPRRHMQADLARYRYLARMATVGLAPKVTELPKELRPEHGNVNRDDVPFVDRFKVQRWDRPSTTITSHIAKDGHYYIHPDPEQMRSLTVREAARLQTFPDDYYFCGNRTAQYHQVGNAVPPLLAYKIAEKVATILGR